MAKWHHEKHIVSFYECDPSRTVHNSKYFIWFENARFEIAKESNLDSYIEKLQEEKGDLLLFPVLEAECKFLLPIPLGTKLILRTKLEKPKAAKLVFKHVITGELDGKDYGTATTVVGILSSKRGLLISLNEDIQKLINDYIDS